MRTKSRLLLTALLLSVRILLNGQVADSVLITRIFEGLGWDEFAARVEKACPVRFYYQPGNVPDLLITLPSDTVSLLPYLSELFETYSIKVSADKYGNIFLIKNGSIGTRLPDGFFDYAETLPEGTSEAGTENETAINNDFLNTYKDFIIENVIIGSKVSGFGSSKATVWGNVTSFLDSLPVEQANVYIDETKNLAVTNNAGYYQITLSKGKYTLVVSSLGNYEKKFKLELLSDGQLDIKLDPQIYSLTGVEITSDRFDNVKGTQMGYEKLTIISIKEIPVVLGEKDLMKVALLLPGIQSVGEGTGGFNVRGSPVDQNLFYINSVPVYNTSHVFGFFSAFNPDAVNDFTIYKSNIPVQYGGRLASIFNITARQGNPEKFSFRGGISPVAVRLLVEGPFKKDNSSYMLSLRSTYSDWVLKLVRDQDIKNSSVFFTDAIANLSFSADDRNRISFFSYMSYDKASINKLNDYDYGNAGASLSWTNIFKQKHSAGITLVYDRYGLDEENLEYELTAYSESFKLGHTELKADIALHPSDRYSYSLGMSSILYHASKGDIKPLNEASTIIPKSFEPEKGIENAIYAGGEWKLSPKWIVNGGLRYTVYSNLGPKTVYTYIDGLPVEEINVEDTLYFGRNSFIKSYDGLDVRLGATYLVNDNVSLKAGYNRLHQYIFLLSNTIAVAPSDTWKLCDYHIRPMVGDQYTLGIYSNLLGEMIEVSVEGYYKDIKNLVEYKDGVDLTGTELAETAVVQGDMDSYGIEFMLKKPFGNLNGWVNYTWSRAIVTVNDPETGQQNNFGKPYPASFDKPHAFNIVLNYRVSRRLSFSTNVVYSTGRPVTYPTAIYYLNGTQITHYSMRNEYRLPDYFRVDLSMNVEGNLLARKFIHSSFSFSVYNLTGRNNAYSVYFVNENGKIEAYRLSIFGVPIFSVSYNFKLGNYAN
jgi:hypothetical protein